MNEHDLQDLLFEREWRKCAPDWNTSTTDELLAGFEYWCSKYVYIRYPGRGKILFKLRDAQRDSARQFLGERYTIVLKARQIGFSTLVSIFCFWCTFFYSDRTIIMLSKTERDAQKLLRHARYAARYLPDWMKLRGPLMNINQAKIEFTNESVMESLPSASDPARGETVFIIVVDEMGQLPNSEDAWASIEPVADLGGRVIMLGTANGEGNLFHKQWIGSKGTWIDRDGTLYHEGTGTNRFKSIFHGWWTADRDELWYEAKKRDLPPWQLAQEYPSNPEEAFLKSGRPVFDIAVLRRQIVTDPVRGWLDEDEDGHNFVEDMNGPLRVWQEPQPDVRYTIGVDVAEGLEHGDFSSLHVIHSKSGEVVAHWHGHIDPDLLGTEVAAVLGRWYNKALVLVESNNHGLTTLTALKREGYFPLYHQKRLASRNQKATDVMGWRTTVASKPLAIDELNRMLRDEDVTLFDSETIAELRSFQRDERGRTFGAPHDDRVMSLAIAAQGLKYVHNREYIPQEDLIKPGTVEWHFRQLMPHMSDDPDPKVGAFAVAS